MELAAAFMFAAAMYFKFGRERLGLAGPSVGQPGRQGAADHSADGSIIRTTSLPEMFHPGCR
ncbi:hypothetical protein [Roseibium salinum]|uniref:Uncharacterized protein n=2 Tax=Roseibium salinum TaxID=1604349 RepID=A0ABT3R9H0_9HYPH|nr:hypothetical protein [Roseibium sp. DSM 29163]MCX2725743.1 hypothetical protein [Roseibium sp. DSM 29163]